MTDMLTRLRYEAVNANTLEQRIFLEQVAEEMERLEQALLTLANQHSGTPVSTARADCMASMARLALRQSK